MAIDELNTIPKQKSVSSRALPYEQYFGEMELTEEQKEERTKLAKDFEDMMLFLFALLAIVSEFSYENIQFVVNQVESRYLSVLGEYMALDDYLNSYARQFAEDTVRTTTEHSSDAWYTSSDRAMYVAENESNTSFNYSEYRQAVEQGKTQKQWITMRDKRVRHTHAEVDGETVGIEEVFLVGTSMMLFPKDDSLGAAAKEIINCRCSVKYIGSAGKSTTNSTAIKSTDADARKNFNTINSVTLEKKAETDKIELQRKTDDSREDVHFITDEMFNRLTISVRKKGAIIIRGTEWAEKHLDEVGAAASIIANVIFFRKDVCISDVLEETYHFEQNLLGMNDDKETGLRSILNEIDAKQYLLKIAKKYKIPRNETELTKRQLKAYQLQLAERQE